MERTRKMITYNVIFNYMYFVQDYRKTHSTLLYSTLLYSTLPLVFVR